MSASSLSGVSTSPAAASSMSRRSSTGDHAGSGASADGDPTGLAMPERAHLKLPSNAFARQRSVEDELSQAMLSPLFSIDGLARATLPTASQTDFGSHDTDVSVPDSVRRAPQPKRRATAQSLRRQRSLSTGSLDKDPFAWLRQTVQEQRATAASTQDSPPSPTLSLPSSPSYSTVPAEAASLSAERDIKPDYFGASVLTLIAGRESVQKRVAEQARRSSEDSQGRLSFSVPSLPAFQAPSLPKWHAPSMPDWKAPSMPDWRAPSLPEFKAPSLPDARQWMPGSLKSSLGINAGEGESQKYMDDEDKTGDEEPDWARIKDKYEKPKLPIVFLHGLFGFSVLGPSALPALQIQYWRGVREALEQLGVEVLMTTSPPTGNIETRAKSIYEQIRDAFPGREINIIGHSMGGLDARYLITHLQPTDFTVRTCTTIATPHRGSAFADYLLDDIVGRRNLPALMSLMQSIQLPGGGHAFDALTTGKMARFNEETPDDPDIQYFSYGARFRPSYLDVFRLPWSIIFEKEGENDGLVSVSSSQWGDYQATLENVNHLDLVGWVGKVRFAFASFAGKEIKFKPVSFYLAIAERLAQAGY